MRIKDYLIYLMTALVILAQGLYFGEQWLIALVAVSLILIIRVVRKKTLYWQWSGIGIFLMVNVLLNGVGLFWYLEKGMQVFGLLRSLLYLVFWLLMLQYDQKIIHRIEAFFVYSMSVIGSFTVLIYMTGWFDSLDYVIDHRVSGPVQYANTYGILLIAALILLFELEVSVFLRFLLTLGLMVPLILTMSRGVYLVAIIMVLMTILIRKHSLTTYWPILASIAVGACILFFFDVSETSARLTESTDASEWHSRLLYYRDAVKMILDRPFGYGSNGYHYAQSYYQTGSVYHVKFVHSGIIQAFLDGGILMGIAMAVFMFCCVFLGSHPMAERLVLTALLGHSLIDMNLQFPIIWLLIILLLTDNTNKEALQIYIRYPAISIVILIIGAGIYMTIPTLYYARGDYEESIQYYPWYTEAYRQLLKTRDDSSMADYGMALVRMNPYVTEGYGPLVAKATEDNNHQLAVDYSERKVYYSPLLIEYHEAYSHALILAATYYHAYSEDERAILYLEKILGIPETIRQLAKERDTDYNVKHKPDLRMTAALMKDYEEAAYLMKIIDSNRKKNTD